MDRDNANEDLLPVGARVSNTELMRLKYVLLGSKQQQKRLYKGNPGGERLSRRRGQGLDFAEVRAYQPGDDVRAIHWRVTARSGKTHTKIFHEQREQPLLLVIDASAAMHFGTQQRFKIVQALNLATLFAWNYALDGERVALVMVDGERSWGTPPSRSSYAVAKAVEAMLRCFHEPPSTSHARLYQFIPNSMRTHSRIVFIGDSYSIGHQHEIFLSKLARSNSVAAIAIHDRLESELPHFDLAFRGAGARTDIRVDAADSAARARYHSQFIDQHHTLGDSFAKLGARYSNLSTAESALQHFWTCL